METIRAIVGDIGGTNCRLAECDPNTGIIGEIRVMPVRDFKSLDQAIDSFKDLFPFHRFRSGSISIANPIVGDRITMTNAHWDFSIEQTRKNCRLDNLSMLNDWESVALSLPVLGDLDVTQINTCRQKQSGNRALCGVGTGLGAAGLVRSKDSPWVPVAGEGGHASFSPVSREEAEILEILRQNHETHVSFEKLLSGAGLTSLHGALGKLSGGETLQGLAPAVIVARAAQESDPLCQRTIQFFCGVLGSFAGNLCLTLGATGGIYVGGGVVQKISEAGLFDEMIFLNRLTDKGRLSTWLAEIPAYIIDTQYAGLIGAAKALGINHARVRNPS